MSLKAAVKRLSARVRGASSALPPVAFPGYADDPAGFARDVLGVALTRQQASVVDALLESRRVLVSSGHSVGKSTLGACLVLWWHYCREGPCLTTAPTERQVVDILWKEVRTLAGRAGLPERFAGPKAPRLEYSAEHFAHGFTARDATRFQGHHSRHGVFVVFDEAEGVDEGFWRALKTMLDDRSLFVAFYNPTEPGSACHRAEQEADRHGTFRRLTLSCLDHPNVTGDGPAVPGAVTVAQLRAMLVEDSQELPPGEEAKPGDVELGGVRYRPGPVAEARCLGRRPAESSAGLWGEGLWARVAATRYAAIDPRWPVQIGCDVARFGDDCTAIVVRQGYCVRHAETHQRRDSGWVAARLRDLCREFANEHNDPRRIPVLVDDTGGYGAGVVDQAGGYLFVGCNASSAAREAGRFANLRSELWFAGRQPALLAGQGGQPTCLDVSRLPPATAQRLRAELAAARYRYRAADGRVAVAPKEEMKAALGRSPDLADAFNLAYYPATGGC